MYVVDTLLSTIGWTSSDPVPNLLATLIMGFVILLFHEELHRFQTEFVISDMNEDFTDLSIVLLRIDADVIAELRSAVIVHLNPCEVVASVKIERSCAL